MLESAVESPLDSQQWGSAAVLYRLMVARCWEVALPQDPLEVAAESRERSGPEALLDFAARGSHHLQDSDFQSPAAADLGFDRAAEVLEDTNHSCPIAQWPRMRG